MIAAELDRRSVLAFAGVAAASVATPALAGGAATRPVRYVLTDRRFAESLEFGGVLMRRGAIRLELTQGLTEIWRKILAPHWRSDPSGVAGLTAPGAWHALAEQARGEGRRSALIGRHAIAPQAGRAAHIVTAPASALAATGKLNGEPHLWPSAMAELAVRCASAPRRCDGEWRSEPRPSPGTAPHSLLTWIIA